MADITYEELEKCFNMVRRRVWACQGSSGLLGGVWPPVGHACGSTGNATTPAHPRSQPALDACQKLGVGLTMVKRLSRKYGIKRWPFRKNRAMMRNAGPPTSPSAQQAGWGSGGTQRGQRGGCGDLACFKVQ